MCNVPYSWAVLLQVVDKYTHRQDGTSMPSFNARKAISCTPPCRPIADFICGTSFLFPFRFQRAHSFSFLLFPAFWASFCKPPRPSPHAHFFFGWLPLHSLSCILLANASLSTAGPDDTTPSKEKCACRHLGLPIVPAASSFPSFISPLELAERSSPFRSTHVDHTVINSK